LFQSKHKNNVKDNILKELKMVRLVGVDLPRNKRIAYALTYIHGIADVCSTVK
jgi:hypothetical protein